METGKTIVLLNLENLYESLYDALNQASALTYIIIHRYAVCREQWLRGRASDYRLRGPRFESCAAVLNVGHLFHFTLLQFTQLYE